MNTPTAKTCISALPFALLAMPGVLLAASSGVVTKTISPDEQAQAQLIFNREAVEQALPMVMPIDYGPSEVDQLATAIPEALARVAYSEPGPAAPGSVRKARAAYPADWIAADSPKASAAQAEIPLGTSQVYDSYTVNSWTHAQTIYPHKWIGRLSFTTPDGTAYCSATSISGNNFLTAAHCVYDTINDRFYSNWVFSPAYRDGNAPFGRFSATTCSVLTSWVNLSGGFSINTWSRHDVAVCTVGRNSAGQTLNNAVGWAGRQWNYGNTRHYFDFGYPWKNYNNESLGATAGKYLRTCVGESFLQTTNTLGLGCNYGPGISGGPWLVAYQQNATSAYVNGDNSGLYIGTQNLYGPKFTDANIVPLCNVRGC